MSRNLVLTAGEGQTGHLIAELLLTNREFSDKIKSLTIITANPDHPFIKEFGDKVTVVKMTPGDTSTLVQELEAVNADTIMLIPPAVDDKVKVTQELMEAAKLSGVQNAVLLSSAGCDMAERDTQPRLREFIDIEAMFMSAKGDPSTELGHSPCIIRAGFYAENLLLYHKSTKDKAKLPLPVGETHQFAPVALGDIALIAAHAVTEEGPKGLSDRFRGQLITLTGPMLTAGQELAVAASQALGSPVHYQNISENEAKKILAKETEISQAEKEYLLEYYSLVREGKTNYISTHAFHDITGSHPQEPVEFFKGYEAEFKPKKRKTRK